MNIGYRLFKILCYADDAVIMSENEDDLQRMPFKFQNTAQIYNKITNTDKTKSMVIAIDTVRCKLV